MVTDRVEMRQYRVVIGYGFLTFALDTVGLFARFGHSPHALLNNQNVVRYLIDHLHIVGRQCF